MFPAHTRLQKLARHLTPGTAASRYRTQQPNNNIATATTSSVPFRLMATATTSASRQTRTYGFEVSPATKSPLGEGKWIKTAACLIIG